MNETADVEEETKALSLGAIVGGQDDRTEAWLSGVHVVSTWVQRSTGGVDTPFSVNVVFHIPGPVWSPDYAGLRTGSFSTKVNLLMIQVAVDVDPPSDTPRVVLALCCEAVDAAEKWGLRRKKLAAGQTLETLREILREVRREMDAQPGRLDSPRLNEPVGEVRRQSSASAVRGLCVDAVGVAPTAAMSIEEFWGVIALLDWDSLGDDEAVLAPAVAALAEYPIEKINGFSELLAEHLFALDTREHARFGFLGEADPDNGDDYLSADGFLYLRCAVVANGQDFTEGVIEIPSRMPRELEFEALLYLAEEAFAAKTGDDYDYDTAVNRESFSNVAGWAPTERTIAGRYTSDAVPPMNRRPG